MFTGTYTAIVTPFKHGKIDEAALERLIRLQVRAGVDGKRGSNRGLVPAMSAYIPIYGFF